MRTNLHCVRTEGHAYRTHTRRNTFIVLFQLKADFPFFFFLPWIMTQKRASLPLVWIEEMWIIIQPFEVCFHSQCEKWFNACINARAHTHASREGIRVHHSRIEWFFGDSCTDMSILFVTTEYPCGSETVKSATTRLSSPQHGTPLWIRVSLAVYFGELS